MSPTDTPPWTPPQRQLLARWATELWQPERRGETWDVVIVGSGYGGAAAAVTLARAMAEAKKRGDSRPLKVCVLERGKEYLPGDFPSRFSELPRHLRLSRGAEVADAQEGLLDLRLGPDVMTLVANGLGGGSLINAGVMLEPKPEEVDDGNGREVLRALIKDRWFDKAAEGLGARAADTAAANTIDEHPCHKDKPLDKWLALQSLDKGKHRSVPITVQMRDGDSSARVPMKACTLCGDCMTGCNVGAKKSLDTHWLALAAQADVKIYTGASVLSVRAAKGPHGGKSSLSAKCEMSATGETSATSAKRPSGATGATGAKGAKGAQEHANPERSEDETADGARWVLRVAHTNPRMQRREDDLLRLRARHVVLAAGTLGSTEILLRSRSDKLALSPRLGQRFSCNGDGISALYRLPKPTGAVAHEEQPLHKRRVGPTITGSVRVEPPRVDTSTSARERGTAARAFEVQEFAVPAAMSRLFEEVVTTAHVLHSLPTADLSEHGHEGASADPMAVDPEATGKTLVVGTIGHDEARGVLHMDLPRNGRDGTPQQGTVQIRWPDARLSPLMEAAHEGLHQLHQALPPQPGAPSSLLANPVWRMLPNALESLVGQPRGPVWTVHPLGGCAVGKRAEDGVVDEFGRVFDARPVPKVDANLRPRSDECAPPESVHNGLWVMDGSVIGQSLGVNPALTIAAFGLRAAQALAEQLICEVREVSGRAAKSTSPHPPTTSPSRAEVPLPQRKPEPEPQTYAPGKAPSTEVELLERLRGPVTLRTGPGRERRLVAELTMAYEPVTVRSMMSMLGSTMHACATKETIIAGPLDAPVKVQRLRFYDADLWHRDELRVKSEREREQAALVEVVVKGQLHFLHREVSSAQQRRRRALWAWLLNRGLREIWQVVARGVSRVVMRQPDGNPVATADGSPAKRPSWCQRFRELWNGATRAGEVRRFDYRLSVVRAELGPQASQGAAEEEDARSILALFSAGQVVQGEKRITYNRRGNPWQQLTRMTLTALPGLAGGTKPVLEIDTRFLAGQGVPLLRITGQRDHATALADMASLGLYLARVVLGIHLWTFRKPDVGERREPDRLPGPIKGLPAPQVSEIVVDRVSGSGAPVKVLLTRYARPLPPLPPLVMLHGYSVSGNTFTHESLRLSAAEYFWRRGRDVWVVDLRTSTGLPTCTLPWSFEQVALVDIPAALQHVQKATGQPVDVLAHCIGCAMLGMALLADEKSVRSGVTELGVADWLTSEHLGVLAAFNNRAPGQPHPTVRRIVLSQKGPLLRYTDDNVLRAFVMQTLRRWLLADDFQFRPPARPGLVDQLLDRFLSSLPYPRADWDVENPLWPCKRTPWTATRHRMDALYGRDFNAENMRQQTLEAIDDLFGPIHLETVAQTIHFTRFNAITNQRGRGEFVTRKRLRERWSRMPTMAVHGSDNGLVDVTKQTLLEQQLGAAGVPVETCAPFEGMGHQDLLIGCRAEEVFERIEQFLGKADAEFMSAVPAGVVSAPAAQEVDKLGVAGEVPEDDGVGTAADADPGSACLFELPWVGPRIDMPDANSGLINVAALSRPDQGCAQLVLIPAQRVAAAAAGAPGTATAAAHTIAIVGGVPVLFSAAKPSGEWLRVGVPQPTLVPSNGAGAAEPGWLALLLYPVEETAAAFPHASAADETQARVLMTTETPGALAQPPAEATAQTPRAPAQPQVRDAIAPVSGTRAGVGVRVPIAGLGQTQFAQVLSLRPPNFESQPDGAVPEALSRFAQALQLTGASAEAVIALARAWQAQRCVEEHRLAFISRADLRRAAELLEGRAHDKVTDAPWPPFAVASCQYPAGMLDSLLARRSLDLLAQRAAKRDVRYALLVGDQIYADATAGLADAVRSDELFQQPNERALRTPWMRAVLRQLPVATLPDDHEIADNWEPLARRFASMPDDPSRPVPPEQKRSRAPRWQFVRQRGLAAFSHYQRMRQLQTPADPTRVAVADHHFVWGGLPHYLLDTRTGRALRSSAKPSRAHRIVQAHQWRELKAWLLANKDHPKVVATPSMLLPRRIESFAAAGASSRCDAWCGYPGSLGRLLDFMLHHQVRNTLFVSGDEHHSLLCSVDLTPKKGQKLEPVRLLSLHSSALYAPFPFANGRRDDTNDDSFVTPSGLTRVCMHTTHAAAGDGFAIVRWEGSAQAPALQVEFVKAHLGADAPSEKPTPGSFSPDCR